VEHLQDHAAFELETHERYRQQAARLGSSPGSPRAAGNQHSGNPYTAGR
jgi:hypothetical protein